jgi:hypothetical protein
MRLLASLIISLFISASAYADIVSLQSAYVQGQTNVIDKLNDDRTKLVNGVNNAQGS